MFVYIFRYIYTHIYIYIYIHTYTKPFECADKHPIRKSVPNTVPQEEAIHIVREVVKFIGASEEIRQCSRI